MGDPFDRLKDWQRQAEKLRSEYQQEAKKVLTDAFLEFLDEHPEVEAIKWSQYTPYFMDGDPCYFSVNDPQIRATGETEFMWSLSSRRHRDEKAFDKLNGAYERVCQLFAIPDEIFEAAFGDHVEVTVTNKGVEVDTMSHD